MYKVKYILWVAVAVLLGEGGAVMSVIQNGFHLGEIEQF